MLRHIGDPGGIQVLSMRVARHIAEQMPDVEAHFLYRDASQCTMLAHLPARHVVLPAPSRFLWDQQRVPAYARRAGLDIILNAKFSMPLVTRVRTVAMLPGAEQWVASALFSPSDRLYNRFVQPLLLRSAAVIVTLTEHGRQDIAGHLGIDPRHVEVIPPGVSVSMRPAPAEEQHRVRARYHLPRRFILFVGGLSPLKNGENLVRAFSLLAGEMPDVDLVFAGFRRSAATQVFDLVDALGVRERVHEPGYIDEADLPALYSSAECLALPSWYEGFGIPIIEAMACGCPVVTSTAGCCPEVAGGAAVLVPPEHPDQIAAGLGLIMRDPGLRAACIQRGFEHSARFDWDTTGHRLAELLRALGRQSSQPGDHGTLPRLMSRLAAHGLWLCGLNELMR